MPSSPAADAGQAGQDKAIEVPFAILAADEKDHPHKATLTTVRERRAYPNARAMLRTFVND